MSNKFDMLFEEITKLMGERSPVDIILLGSFLCLIYISDLEEGVKSNIVKFADD